MYLWRPASACLKPFANGNIKRGVEYVLKIAMFSCKPYDRTFFDVPGNPHDIQYLEAGLGEATALLADGHDAVCCFVNDTVNAKVLECLHEYQIRLVALRCAGYNNVDLDRARELGISVCRVPDYSPHAVAEHTVGLILTLNRQIHRAFNRVRENDYSLNGLMGFDLYGKTVGVIGTGKIGATFARIMHGFSCRVLVHDPFRNPDLDGIVQYVELEEIWRESDILSLHCPLTPDTHHLINEHTLRLLKPGVMLINTSRGGLIDASATILGLKSGQIGYLGLDVYEEEGDMFFENHSNEVLQDDVFARLTTFRNVLVTGHQAFFTREALERIADVTITSCTAFEKGCLDASVRVV